MLGVFLILILAIWLAFLPLELPRKEPVEHSAKFDNQMKQLWGIAQTSMKESKPSRAERALLTILKFDEQNAAAYNRLGILYAKNQKYSEAIECFEIAQSLDKDNPICLHNVGLIYLETGAYEKAAMAFRQAIELEGDVPARHIALSKALEKIGKRDEAIEALENACARFLPSTKRQGIKRRLPPPRRELKNKSPAKPSVKPLRLALAVAPALVAREAMAP